MHPKIILLFSCFFITAMASASSPDDKSKSPQCRPIEYTLSSNDPAYGAKFSITYRWLFDEQGRLIEDSVYNGANVLGGPDRSAYDQFFYKGDSVIHVGYANDTSFTIYSRTGLIASESLPFGVKYITSFKPNGELEMFKVMRPFIGRRGTIENQETISDSIVYSNGNIISYRVRNSSALDTFYMVTCAYYEDQINSIEFYPMGKITGLSSNPMGMFGSLNVSLFSKSLIKKVESTSNSLEFVFRLDDHGRVADFDRIFSYTYAGKTTTATDHNAIKYSCRQRH